ACCWLAAAAPARADAGRAGQQRAAEEYLQAVARGDAQAMALSILEAELAQLRTRLLDEMRLEADRGNSLTRTRLFGDGMPLADIERLTPHSFFVTLAQRLRFGGREFRKVDWLEAVKDRGGMVQMVGRLIPPEELGEVRVPVVVSIVPWGKDWKAALPLDLQAQIDDLRAGRTRAPAGGPPAASNTAVSGGSTPPAPALPPGIVKLFDEALASLEAARCDHYFAKQMSPNFRRTTAWRASASRVSNMPARVRCSIWPVRVCRSGSGSSSRSTSAGTSPNKRSAADLEPEAAFRGFEHHAGGSDAVDLHAIGGVFALAQ